MSARPDPKSQLSTDQRRCGLVPQPKKTTRVPLAYRHYYKRNGKG